MSNKTKGVGDKRTQWWSSIRNQKLDALRWVMLHSGLNVGSLEDDDGKTGIQIAALENKGKSMLVMLDILRQKRELKEAIDRPDEAGCTPLILAAHKGALDCVEHLMYYGATPGAKDAKGLTARDHAVAGRHKAVVEYLDEAAAEASGANSVGVEAGNGLDEDGLTSTQRSKAKKRAIKEAERALLTAAVLSAAAAKGDTMPEGMEEEGGEEEGEVESAVVPKLPASAPAAKWPELVTVLAEKRREMKVDWTGKSGEGEAPVLILRSGTWHSLTAWRCA